MKGYQFSLWQDGNLSDYGQGYGQGNNAVEAFENAVKASSVILPVNELITVSASSEDGLTINFEVMKSY